MTGGVCRERQRVGSVIWKRIKCIRELNNADAIILLKLFKYCRVRSVQAAICVVCEAFDY
jgi:hypothetical protein